MTYAAGLRANTLSSRVIPDTLPPHVVLVLAGSAPIAACARISFEFSFSTVPVTGQTFGVLLVGALYQQRSQKERAIPAAKCGLPGAMPSSRSEVSWHPTRIASA